MPVLAHVQVVPPWTKPALRRSKTCAPAEYGSYQEERTGKDRQIDVSALSGETRALELAQWRVFLAVSQLGSLHKAAEGLHTDQPALSRSLRRLERLVGAPLFVRSSRGLTLTDLGRRLQEPAWNLIDLADAVETQARAEARQATGIIKIGALDVYPMTSVIADACQDLSVANPAVIADVVSQPWLAHPRALLERTIDIGFTLTVDGRLLDPETIRSRPLWEETESFALISDHHPLAGAEVIDPRDLADLPLHLPDKTDNPDIYHLILEQLADAGVPAPRRAPPLGTFANVIAHIASGGSWTLSARTLARRAPPGITARPLATSLRRTVKFEILWHVNTNTAALEAFTEGLEAALVRRRLSP
jgi:DNA-binding transcriptional LysR family regulator